MPRRIRSSAEIVGRREATAIAATLGGQAREARRHKRWSLGQVARRVGLGAARLSEIERGLGTRAPLETLVALGIALDRPLAVTFTRPLGQGAMTVDDGGHLEIQECILRLARATGRPGTFEVPTRPADPSRSTDVGIRDPATRTRILAECWNTFGDLGAAVRATRRKEFEVATAWPEDRIATVWVVRTTAANRALVARYPAILDTAFPGSSRRWVKALTAGGPPPRQPGFVWYDASTGRLIERRRATIGP
jgi:transcriptional regulator with XRE-family HTH domain